MSYEYELWYSVATRTSLVVFFKAAMFQLHSMTWLEESDDYDWLVEAWTNTDRMREMKSMEEDELATKWGRMQVDQNRSMKNDRMNTVPYTVPFTVYGIINSVRVW